MLSSRYNDVCLVLDGEDYECTTKSSGQDGRVIRWKVPKRLVKVIKIDFRSNDYHDYAQIGDLKIYFYNINTAEEQFLYDVEKAYSPTLPVIGSFAEKQLWIKERVANYVLKIFFVF